MRILIATDAWFPQINGVVRTLSTTAEMLRRAGHEVHLLTPEGRRTIPLPTYREIRLSLVTAAGIARTVEAVRPEAIHIATEGSIGLALRHVCLRRGLPFTTGYHTRFPEYLSARIPLPGIERGAYAFLRWFHGPSRAVMVPTRSMADVLEDRGFGNVRVWTRGVDHDLFRPDRRMALEGKRPIALYAGRVAVEKGIDAFLALPFEGTKYVVGDGPALEGLKARYPDARYTGYRMGEALAATMAGADVFVFPSRTDTFGLVMLEALASGVPVAAYPVPGPRDVVVDGKVGGLDEDLGEAVRRALACDRAACRAYALGFTWEKTAELFARYLAPFEWPG